MKYTHTLLLALVLSQCSCSFYYDNARSLTPPSAYIQAGAYGFINRQDQREPDLRGQFDLGAFNSPYLKHFNNYYGYFSELTGDRNDIIRAFRKNKTRTNKYKIIEDELKSLKKSVFDNKNKKITEENFNDLLKEVSEGKKADLHKAYLYTLLLDSAKD